MAEIGLAVTGSKPHAQPAALPRPMTMTQPAPAQSPLSYMNQIGYETRLIANRNGSLIVRKSITARPG